MTTRISLRSSGLRLLFCGFGAAQFESWWGVVGCRMGGAIPSAVAQPSEGGSDTHHFATDTKKVDGFRERSTHPTGFFAVSESLNLNPGGA
jgi:hypothetical protein